MIEYDKEQKQHAVIKVQKLIGSMFKIWSQFSDDKEMILSLANNLDILLTQKKYGGGKSLFEYVHGDMLVPKILSIKTHIRDHFQIIRDSYDWVKTPKSPKEFYRYIQRSHSFIVCNGLPKLLVVPSGNSTNIDAFLATPILLLMNKNDKRPLWFSIADIITLVRNKETAHFDIGARYKRGDKFATLFQHYLKDRHTLILAISEFIIGLYERGDDNRWCMVQHFHDQFSLHYNTPDNVTAAALGNVSGPLIVWRLENMKEYYSLTNRSGRNFTICELSSKSRMVIDDKGYAVVQYDDKKTEDLRLSFRILI